MGLFERLVAWRRFRLVREFLLLYGLDIPREVKIGKSFKLSHRGFGTVVHPKTTIGDRVWVYHNVTIGRQGIHLPDGGGMEGIEICDDAILCAGSSVLGGRGVTSVGAGTIVAANAVLTRSTGDWEIWAGVPARKIADRPRLRGLT